MTRRTRQTHERTRRIVRALKFAGFDCMKAKHRPGYYFKEFGYVPPAMAEAIAAQQVVKQR